MHIQFVINTTPAAFYGWLREYTQEQFYAGGLQFPHEGGPIHLQPATIEPTADPHSPVARLVLRGHQLTPEDDGKTVTARGGFAGNETIVFKLVPLDDRRIEVTATCGVPLVEPYLSRLLTTIGRRYPESAAEVSRQMRHRQPGLREWAENRAASVPWERDVPFALEDVEAATFEHLARLAGKRFPVDWQVAVTPYKEQERIALRYDIQSGRNMVGHFRIRRIGAQETRLEVKPFAYGNEAGEARLREIMAVFAGRWLAELETRVEPLQLASSLLPDVSQSGEGQAKAASDRAIVDRAPDMNMVSSGQAKAPGSTNKEVPARDTEEPEPLIIRAQKLRLNPKRLLRWDRIRDEHLPKGLTQQEIAEIEDLDVETIKGDYRDMRKAGFLPPLLPP